MLGTYLQNYFFKDQEVFRKDVRLARGTYLFSLPGPKVIGKKFFLIFRQASSHRDKANHQRQEKTFQKNFRR